MCQAKIALIIESFFTSLSEEQAKEVGRQAANLLMRIGMLSDAVLVPDGWSTDFSGLAAMLNMHNELGAREAMERNNVPFTKPIRQRIYSTENVTQKFEAATAD